MNQLRLPDTNMPIFATYAPDPSLPSSFWQIWRFPDQSRLPLNTLPCVTRLCTCHTDGILSYSVSFDSLWGGRENRGTNDSTHGMYLSSAVPIKIILSRASIEQARPSPTPQGGYSIRVYWTTSCNGFRRQVPLDSL